jgi:hypothetical protein
MSKHKALPCLERLHELLILDPSSPSGLRWKCTRSTRVKSGSVAGGQRSRKYWRVRIDKEYFSVHRIVYFMYHGVDPGASEIDHKNGDKGDNSIENLRLVDHSTNIRNQRAITDTISGHRNILKLKVGPSGKPFKCQFKSPVGSLSKRFKTLEEAIAQRKAWEEEYFPGVYLREDGL